MHSFDGTNTRAARWLCCALLTCWLVVSGGPAWGGQTPEAKPAAGAEPKLDEKISRLIEQLGHDNYILREQAQEELQQIGAPALDALTNALSHNDIEVVMRTRYLLSAIRIPWTVDTDPARIRETMRDYDKQQEDQRRAIMLRLAQIGGASEVDVLCRMIRYEKSQILSKRAALLVIGLDEPDEGWDGLAKRVERNLHGSQRSGVVWLRSFLQHRGNPDESLAEWKRLTEEEQALWNKSSLQTNYDIVQALLFQLIDLLEAVGQEDQTEKYMQQIVDLQPNDEDSIKTLVEWLDDKNALRVVVAIAEKFPHVFDGDPMLLYSLAHAQHELGNAAMADQAAQRARKLNPNVAQHHLVVAFQLQERGWFEWSEQEYRMVISIAGLANELALRATFLLSEMLHDQQQEKKAAEAMEALVNLMKSNPQVLRNIRLMERDTGSIQSRMEFFYACHFELEGNTAKQIEHLDRAIAADPRDADVLIALYRLPRQDDQRRKRTEGMIREAMGYFRQQIAAAPDSATGYNQFAWLVGNTLGETDKGLGDEAIRNSHKSLEIRPDAAGYLDTLGRCYYGRRDYENAVKYQAEAAKLDPHSGLIQRQLKLFEKALAESKGKS